MTTGNHTPKDLPGTALKMRARRTPMSGVAFYGLDIETDTGPLTTEEKRQGYTARGLDPAITRITAIAISSSTSNLVLQCADERMMLQTLDSLLAILPTGTITTWNGAVFDLPFIQSRAAQLDVELGLRLTPNPDITPKYDFTPGHTTAYDAQWGRHNHIDIAYDVQTDAKRINAKWSLKPFAKDVFNLTPVEVDRENMHLLTDVELTNYVASDAEVTRQITELLYQR